MATPASEPTGNKRRAVVYACSHRRWLDETLRSAKSCREQMPRIHRVIYCTEDLAEAIDAADCFDEIVLIETQHTHRPRFEAMLHCTHQQALFIDGDTYFTVPVVELFAILSQFDLGIAIAPQHFHPDAMARKIYSILPPVSIAIPEWNSGVIVARTSERFRKFVKQWAHLFELCRQHGYQMDQPALRSALAESDLRIATLPNNYNFRAGLAQSVRGVVKILHAHGKLAEISRHINTPKSQRFHEPNAAEVHGYLPERPDSDGDEIS